MISKVKDLSKVILNAQDVMLRAKLVGKKTSLIMPDDMSQKMKDELAGDWIYIIEAVGSEVKGFKPELIVSIKAGIKGSFELVNDNDTDSDRIIVIHMNNIEYAVEPDNYKE